MKWYFQTSPHDTHDWDSAQTPILIDATINGRPRKLVSTAARNGYFFTVDRVTGEHIVTVKYGTTTNWAKGIRENGSPDPNPEKEATIPGSLVSPVEGGVTNWQPSAYSPDTGLFYAQENNGFNFVYLTDPDPRGSMGLGGKLTSPVGSGGNALVAHRSEDGKERVASSMADATAVAVRACSRRLARCCSPPTATATSSRSTRPTARSCGTRASAASRTRRRPT